MKILGLLEEDFVNYKMPCMTVMFPYCSFKCNKECGRDVCHNSLLRFEKLIDISVSSILNKYLNNPISEAIVMQGLEPFDSFDDLKELVSEFSKQCDDDIVIYTGYTKEEIETCFEDLSKYVNSNNLIIKYGRFIPDRDSKYDSILGVSLASDNQYAEVIKSK